MSVDSKTDQLSPVKVIGMPYRFRKWCLLKFASFSIVRRGEGLYYSMADAKHANTRLRQCALDPPYDILQVQKVGKHFLARNIMVLRLQLWQLWPSNSLAAIGFTR